MKVRLAILVALAALTVAYRGMAIYMRYFSPDLRTRSTFETQYESGRRVVSKVEGECKKPASERLSCLDHAHLGDRVVAIYDGHGRGGEIRGGFDFGAYLRPIGSEESWVMVVDRPIPERGDVRLELRMAPAVPFVWPLEDWLVNLGFDLYLPFLAMAAGLFVGFMRPDNAQAFLAALVFLGFSASFRQEVSQFPVGWREMALLLRATAVAFSPYLILRFFLGFPRRSLVDRKLPWLKTVLLVWTVLIWLVALVLQFAAAYSFALYDRIVGWQGALRISSDARDIVATAGSAAMLVLALLALTVTTVRAGTRDDRRRMILILAGAVAGLLPMAVLYLFLSKVPSGLAIAAILLIGLFPITFVTAVVRHQVFGIRLMIRRGLQYALLSRGFLVVEGVLIFLALYFAVGPLLVRYIPGTGQSLASVGIAAVTLGLVFGTQRVNRFVMPVIDRKFFRDAYNAEHILADLTRAVKHLASRPDLLLERVADEIVEALHPDRVGILLADLPWPSLASRREEATVAWRPEPGTISEGSFLLFVRRRTMEDASSGRGPRGLPDDMTLFSATSISRLLERAVSGGPEILDVFPAGGRRERSGTPPAGEGLRVLGDGDLFDLLDARLIIPFATEGKAFGFLVLGQKRSEEHYTRQDRELLLAVAVQVSIALDYSRMIDREAEQRKLEREVQIARDVQSKLFPQDKPALKTLRYVGKCRAAGGVGGDYFDFLPLGSDRLGIAVADIAGKGLPAALLMASLQALVRSHASVHAQDLGGLAAELNRHLCDSTDDARFATMFFGVYDDRMRELRFVNAGHNPPILARPHAVAGDGGASVSRLGATGTILGGFENRVYEQRKVDLEAGDRVVIFSDGIVEAMNARDEEFGDAALVSLVERHADADEEELARLILDEVGRFVAGNPPNDDMTLIVARVV